MKHWKNFWKRREKRISLFKGLFIKWEAFSGFYVSSFHCLSWDFDLYLSCNPVPAYVYPLAERIVWRSMIMVCCRVHPAAYASFLILREFSLRNITVPSSRTSYGPRRFGRYVLFLSAGSFFLFGKRQIRRLSVCILFLRVRIASDNLLCCFRFRDCFANSMPGMFCSFFLV